MDFKKKYPQKLSTHIIEYNGIDIPILMSTNQYLKFHIAKNDDPKSKNFNETSIQSKMYEYGIEIETIRYKNIYDVDEEYMMLSNIVDFR